MVTIITESKRYFYTGTEIRKGIEIYDSPFHPVFENCERINYVNLEPFRVADYNGRFFLLDEIKIEKGFSVETKLGNGIILEEADTVALVRLFNGDEKVFYKKDLVKDELELTVKSFNSLKSIEPLIEEKLRLERETAQKLILEEVQKSLEEPKGFFGGLKDKVKNLFAGKTPEVKTPEVKAPEPKIDHSVTDLHTGKVSNLQEIQHQPTGNPMLTHVSLHNNIPKHENDKFTYHYKTPTGFKQSSEPLENGDNHEHIKDKKIFVPGEQILHNNQIYNVKSHFHPENPEKMLLHKEGKNFSINRNEAKLHGPDLTKSALVDLQDGTKKFHHQVKEGDMLMKNGVPHKVMHTTPESYTTVGEGVQYLTHKNSYHLPFQHNRYDPNKQAETKDYIKFFHNGTYKTREVQKVDDKHATVKVNNNEVLQVPHGEYSFTGKKAFDRELDTPKQGEATDSGIDKADVESSEFGELLSGEMEHENPEFSRKIKKYKEITGHPSRTKKINDNEYKFRLGIGNTEVHLKHDPETGKTDEKVINPEISMPVKTGKRMEDWKITKIDTENGMIHYYDITDPTSNKKPISIGQFVEMAKKRTEKHRELNPGTKETSEGLKDTLHNNIANTLHKHGIEPGDVKDMLSGNSDKHDQIKHDKVHDAVHKHFENYTEKLNSVSRGSDLIEPEDYEPTESNYKGDKVAELEKHLGKDWHNELSGKVEELIQHKAEREKNEAEREETKKAVDEQTEKTKAAEKQTRDNYVKEVYEKMPSYKEKSLNLKHGVTGTEGRISVKDKRHNNTKVEYHIFPIGSTVTSHEPHEKHLTRHETKAENTHIIPFNKNANFPPTGQARDYHSKGDVGNKNRKHTIETISDDFKPDEIMNLAPQGNTNAPLVDEKVVGLSGRGRTLGERLVSPEKRQESKEYAKNNLKTFFPHASDEQLKNLSDEIDKTEGVELRRVAIHNDGTPYHYDKHNEDWNSLTSALDGKSEKEESQSERRAMLQNKVSDEVREGLFKLVPEGKTVSNHVAHPKNAKQMVDYMVDNKLIEEDKVPSIISEGKMTDEGKTMLNDILWGNYLSGEHEDRHSKLKANHKKQVETFTRNNQSALLDMRVNNKYFDLKPEIEGVIDSFHNEKGQLEGQTRIVEESPETKGLKYIMSLDASDQKEIMKDYQDRANNLTEQMDSGMFAPSKDTFENFKRDFFEKYSKFHDLSQKTKKDTPLEPGEDIPSLKPEVNEPEQPKVKEPAGVPASQTPIAEPGKDMFDNEVKSKVKEPVQPIKSKGYEYRKEEAKYEDRPASNKEHLGDYKGIHPDNIHHFNQGASGNRVTMIVPESEKAIISAHSEIRKKSKDWGKIKSKIQGVADRFGLDTNDADKLIKHVGNKYREFAKNHPDKEHSPIVNTFKHPELHEHLEDVKGFVEKLKETKK